MESERKVDDGASAVEYGLLVFAVAAVIVAVVVALGQVVNETYSKTCNGLDAQASTSVDC